MPTDQDGRVLVDHDALRRARRAAGLRQEDLTDALESDQTYVSKVERGQIKRIPRHRLVRVAAVLKVSVESLTRTEEEPAAIDPAIQEVIRETVQATLAEIGLDPAGVALVRALRQQLPPDEARVLVEEVLEHYRAARADQP